MDVFLEQGKLLGLEGNELLNFVKEQQTIEREERAKDREMRKLELQKSSDSEKLTVEERARDREREESDQNRQSEEREAIRKYELEREERDQNRQSEEREAIRKYELELKRLNLDSSQSHKTQGDDWNKGAKTPKLPSFIDGKDDIDSYLLRFERFAATNNWDKSQWATSLSALLTGKALDVYSRLSDTAAVDYQQLKNALLKRYELTEDGFRTRFRDSKPEPGESPDQFIVRINSYLARWVELSETEKGYEGVCNMFVKEQFINACPKDLATHLRERAPENLQEIAKIADQFLIAHGRQLASVPSYKENRRDKFSENAATTQSGFRAKNFDKVQCFTCNKYGHRAVDCKSQVTFTPMCNRRCYRCDGIGHEAKVCPSPAKSVQKDITTATHPQKAASSLMVTTTDHKSEMMANEAEIQACIEDGKITLGCGKKIPFVSAACTQPSSRSGSDMPVVRGKVGDTMVTVLRDTGCSGLVVRRGLVNDKQLTGRFGYMLLIDNTMRRVPIATIFLDTPYLKGCFEAQCLPDPIYDLIIGNINEARNPDDPDPLWQEACAVTRAQAKQLDQTPLKVSQKTTSGTDYKCTLVDKATLEKMQREDDSIDKFRRMTQILQKGDQEVEFQEKEGILYRLYKCRDKQVRQVLVPTSLRIQVMEIAHNSIMSGHMGIKKTTDRIIGNFYWPGLRSDVTRFCRSCDICQRTVSRGKVPRVPLHLAPIIDTPFKRVAVDLVGPIHPPSEENHRYVLTLVDYATRYPDAMPLKRITTESVAEALLSMYSRLGIPEEILSDMGSQFVSDCMKEVSRLLSIRQLTTTPYHPMCNGLVEKFNGTLKTMLKRLCSEQPRQWHRYIDALLFAYREVPQESTGFSPFELLYGRTVRGPMHILKELWTSETEQPEVKTSYQYVFELRDKIDETLEIARQELQKSQKRYKHYFDKKAKSRYFKPGDLVLLLRPTDNNKLLMQWKGPYKVESVVGKNDYKIRVKDKIKTFHANLLKKFVERTISTAGGAITEVLDTCPVPETALVAIIESADSTEDDAVDDEELLELSNFVPKETFRDVELGKQLTKSQKEELLQLIDEYRHIFTDVPGSTNLIQHRINLVSEEPVRSKPYPVPFHVRESLKQDIQEMIKLGVIRETNSPYASPVVIVKKKDGSNRICIDYRKLNKLTLFDPEPMTTTEDLFQKMCKGKYFSTVDLSKGYWQIMMAEEDIRKTAFVTSDGSYEFLRMPFGLVNAGATMVRAIRKLLHGMDEADNYVDDIIVHTDTWEEQLIALRELFTRLSRNNITARPTKCVLATDSVDFVGHHISKGSVTVLEMNATKVRFAPRPKTKKEIRSFIGLTGYYQNFIPNYASIAVPLTDLTRKGQPNNVQWGEAQEKAYTTLKRFITQKPILKLPDISKHFVLKTDASDVGLGAILLQQHDGALFPVSFASKKLSDRERKYSTMEKECLAIVWGIKKYTLYLYGKEFTLQTDHQSLVYLNRAKFTNDRIMRWALFVQNYAMKVEAIKGRDNAGADYLSRVF